MTPTGALESLAVAKDGPACACAVGLVGSICGRLGYCLSILLIENDTVRP